MTSQCEQGCGRGEEASTRDMPEISKEGRDVCVMWNKCRPKDETKEKRSMFESSRRINFRLTSTNKSPVDPSPGARHATRPTSARRAATHPRSCLG